MKKNDLNGIRSKNVSANIDSIPDEYDDISEYFVKDGEQSPFTDLLLDPAFKKAFSPDEPDSKKNLLNLLNDFLAPQLACPIVDVVRRESERNHTGSDESKTIFFDLHCKDRAGRPIDIEVQRYKHKNFLKRVAFYSAEMVVDQGQIGKDWEYDVKPAFVLALANYRIFDDARILRRACVMDLETHVQILDTFNYTIVELPKVASALRRDASAVEKWMFAFRYLSRLRELPPALRDETFGLLTSVAKISSLKGKQLEEYKNMYHKEWDRAMTRTILFDEFAEDIKKEREAAAAEANARADEEKSRADEANARADEEKSRADKYAAILKEHGLL